MSWLFTASYLINNASRDQLRQFLANYVKPRKNMEPCYSATNFHEFLPIFKFELTVIIERMVVASDDSGSGLIVMTSEMFMQEALAEVNTIPQDFDMI